MHQITNADRPCYESDALRLTPYGAFLRKYSLDELPSLINVLKGDLSFVGPRPLLTDFWVLYTPDQRRRHDVLPGLTGLAQINGRNNISWRKKFRYDVFYVDHQSFFFDCYILSKTARMVFSGDGTNFPVDGYLPIKP